MNPLTVAYGKSGKPRLVLDCRHINQYLIQYKFKYEDIQTAMEMFDLQSYLFCFDLKSAYHHISVKSSHFTYLGFSVTENGLTKYYVYCVLPFGIATAGHIFTKVLRVVVKYWRGQGHKIVTYLDDGIGGHKKYDAALQLSEYIRNSLTEFGFLLAHAKCHWIPTKVQIWLGYVIDMTQGTLFVTQDRVDRAEQSIESIINCLSKNRFIKVRTLASVTGQIISMQTVFGKLVCLKTRAMHECIISRASWDAPVFVTDDALSEFHFWKINLRRLNGKGSPLKGDLTCEIDVFCDASGDGYGGYLCGVDQNMTSVNIERNIVQSNSFLSTSQNACVAKEKTELGCPMVSESEAVQPKSLCNSSKVFDKAATCAGGILNEGATCVGNTTCVGMANKMLTKGFSNGKNAGQMLFSSSETIGIAQGVSMISGDTELFGSWCNWEKGKSSTWRELEAVRRVLYSNKRYLFGKKVKVFSDNKNIKTILKAGSMKKDLQAIAMQIYEFCVENAIVLIAEWIPRELNGRADYLSRCFDCDDWEINNHVFIHLDQKWGPHTVDRFSTNYNNKCHRFNSRWWVPEADAVNAFDQYWARDCNWLVPPPRLVSLCVTKLVEENANGTLVVPEWKSAPFWTKLVHTDGAFRPFINDVVFLSRYTAVQRGRGNNGVFALKPLQFRMIALKIRFA